MQKGVLKNIKLQMDSDEKRTIEDLPEEVLIHILSYLNVPDKKICCRVRHQWNHLIQDEPRLAKDMVYRFNDMVFHENFPKYNVFMTSTRTFFNVELDFLVDKVVDRKLFEKFCLKIGQRTKILRISKVTENILQCQFTNGVLTVTKAKTFRCAIEKYFPMVQIVSVPTLNYFRPCLADVPHTVRVIEIRDSGNKTDSELLISKNLKVFDNMSVKSSNISIRLNGSAVSKEVLDLLSFSSNKKFKIELMSACLTQIKIDNDAHLNQRFAKIQDFDLVTDLKVIEPSSCWFIHKVLLFRNLRKLEIDLNDASTGCDLCVDNFLKSCPKFNSIRLKGTTEDARLGFLRKIFQNDIKFREIHLDSTGGSICLREIFGDEPNDENFINLNTLVLNKVKYYSWSRLPSMPALTEFIVSSGELGESCFSSYFERVVAKCPQVRKFHFTSSDHITWDQAQVMLLHWRYLSEFHVYIGWVGMADTMFVKYFGRNCRELRSLSMSHNNSVYRSFTTVDEDIVNEFYKEVLTLRMVTFGRVRSFSLLKLHEQREKIYETIRELKL